MVIDLNRNAGSIGNDDRVIEISAGWLNQGTQCLGIIRQGSELNRAAIRGVDGLKAAGTHVRTLAAGVSAGAVPFVIDAAIIGIARIRIELVATHMLGGLI